MKGRYRLGVRSKGRVHPRTGYEGPEGEKRYGYTLSLTLALDGGGLSRPRSGSLPPRKTKYPLYRKPGGPQGRSGQVRKNSPPPGFDPPTVQPIASRYTDCAIPAHTDWGDQVNTGTNLKETRCKSID